MTIIFYILFLLHLQTIDTAIQKLPSISLNEQSTIGTSIYDLTRFYSLTNQTLVQFSFLSDSSTHNSYFIVDSLTGRISIKRMIDREELCQTHTCNCERCILTLEIIASSKLIDILSLEILIENINDNPPVFPVTIFYIRLSENTDIGHISTFPAATDLDYQDHIEYRLVDIENDTIHHSFSIVNLQTENQLGLRLLKPLDREKQNFYQMKISASDGEHFGYLTIYIYVIDSNDNVPIFEHDKYKIKLREDTSIGTDILHVHAYDNDEGYNSLINYTIITDNHSSSFPFLINVTTGSIKLVRSLNYEDETNYHFNVRARDNGPDGISVYAQIEIDIIDVNDCPPDIDFILPDNNLSKNIYYFQEENEINTRLFHISVSDKDSNNEKILLKLLTYENIFQLNEQYNDLYNLVVITRLDREQQAEYNLTFEATDQDSELSLITRKHIIIRLIDINDSPPHLEPYSQPININENNPPYIQIIQFQAKDFDEPNTPNSLISYSLVNSNDSQYFHIDSKTGILSVGNITFDYEYQTIYYLIINISDHGINPQRLETFERIEIHIINLNDNKPKFQYDSYRFKLYENISIGTLIGQVQAIDHDTNSTIFYEFDTDKYQHIFDLNHLTGEIRTKIQLDYETQSIYKFYIIVKDNANNVSYSDRVLIEIHLIDINDNQPIIDMPTSIYIPSKYLHKNSSKSIFITTVIANDYDSDKNGNLTFKILEGNEKNYFHIHHSNGTISTQTNHIIEGYYCLKISVCDQGEYIEQCSIININIKIGENVNKNDYVKTKIFNNKHRNNDENKITNQMIIVVIISSIFTLVSSITMGILCAICCKQKRCHHIHRSSLKKPCELLQSTDADTLLSTNNKTTFSPTNKKLTGHHHHLEPYDDIKASGSAVSSQDSCYGSNELSRSSSNGHGIVRPLLSSQDCSSSVSSTSVIDYHLTNSQSTTNRNQNEHVQQQSHHLKTFHSPTVSQSNYYNLKKTVQTFTRRPTGPLQSTYLTYDSVDIPPNDPSISSLSPTTSTTSREYSIL